MFDGFLYIGLCCGGCVAHSRTLPGHGSRVQIPPAYGWSVGGRYRPCVSTFRSWIKQVTARLTVPSTSPRSWYHTIERRSRSKHDSCHQIKFKGTKGP
ncbi:hypothetical protein K443DRAFT_154632 [Laccaria amethystina LaAM-08-1]|uniref:Uncharacterized protein n=1 Tax=Laccaria amethystina LaAM-08-1 TaxID=1095629 RepID=A0A0C9XEH3_9AGAR|nr:hypothetical protein K443DRAFT_154632 [Laccaria amethystina LaAM-08-1]